MNQKLILKELNCPHCAGAIEKKTAELDGVLNASFNMTTKELDVELSENVPKLAKLVKKIADDIEPGISVVPYDSDTDKDYDDEGIKKFHIIRLIFGGASLATAGLVKNTEILSIAFYVAAYVIFGYDVIWRAVKNIKEGEIFDENFLMSIATIGAFLIGEYPEAVAVMLFYQIGELFQDMAVGRASRSIKNLVTIMPEEANLCENDDIKAVPSKDVRVGQIVLIKPGEKVPLDGTVVEGSSYVDKKALTGESVPEFVNEGDILPSGAINGSTPIKIRVEKAYSDSTAQKIVRMTQEAGSKKARAEKFITKFASVYTPTVVFLALAIAVFPTVIQGVDSFSVWLYRALIFLVASCPCALVISIPLGFFAGNGRLSAKGVLVKGSTYIQSLAETDTVVFDKTGTLTEGVFRIENIYPEGISSEELLKICGRIEALSTHPIALAIFETAKEKGLDLSDKLEDFEEIKGMGLRAVWNGKTILAGNAKLLDKFGVKFKAVSDDGSAVYTAVDNKFVGVITVSDTVKADSERTISALKSNNIKTVLLTGDRQTGAEKLNLSLDVVKSELLPEDKLKALEALYKDGSKTVVYMGDGINDAPVLRRADVGVAMGGLGSDTAIEAADAVIMNDEPSKILTAIDLSKKTMARIRQNTAFVIAVKAVVLIISALGFGNMWMAVFADIGTALIAILNSIR